MERSNNKKENELDKLRRENAFLRSQMRSADAKESSALDGSKGYFSYLWKKVKAHSAYRLFERASYFFSRFRLISHAIKIAALILLAVQTSAVLLIVVSILSLVLPPIILLFSVQFILSAARYPGDSKNFFDSTAGKKIIFLFPTRQTNFDAESFFAKNAVELASRGYAVTVVSPFFLSPKSISENRRPYVNLRRECDGITSIRRQYFFFIRKQVLKSHRERVIFIY